MMSHIWPAAARALRSLRRAPAPAAAVAATLALALGACAAVFGVADRVLWRPLPFPGPDALVTVSSAFPRMRLASMGLSGPEALELAALTSGFSAIGPFVFDTVTVRLPQEAVQAPAAVVSAGALAALRVVPREGRLFRADDDRPGAARVAVVGDGLWRRAFGGRREAIGRLIDVDGTPHVIVGVMPPIAILNRTPDVWLPLAIGPGNAGSRSDHRFMVVGRLSAGSKLDTARADVDRAVARWQVETGELHTPAPKFHPLEVRSLADATAGSRRRPMWALVGAVALVLLLASVNVSNLLLVKAERERTDLAIEIALGATRGRILANRAGEGLLLALAGAAGGVVGGAAGLRALQAAGPVLARPEDLALDSRALAVTAVLAILAGVGVGVAPFLRLDVRAAHRWLTESSRGAGAGRGRLRVQRMLVGLQIALAVLLSTSAVLLVRSLVALLAIDPGFEARGVLRAEISLPDGAYTADAAAWSVFDRVLDRVRAAPGVRSASAMSGLPPVRRANNTTFMLDGAEAIDHDHVPQVDYIQHITPEFLETLRIPLVEGRNLSPADDERAQPVAIVNATLARRFWPGQSALGRRLRPAIPGAPWITVVGVAADMHQGGLQVPPGSEVLVSYRQARLVLSSWMPRSMNVVIRVDRGAMALIARALGGEVR